jgi:hypothetical protein
MNRQGGYGEVKFWWKGEDAAKETELVVRGYVNTRRQMRFAPSSTLKATASPPTSVNSPAANRSFQKRNKRISMLKRA